MEEQNEEGLERAMNRKAGRGTGEVAIWASVWKVDLVRAQVGRVRMSWDLVSHLRLNEEAPHTRQRTPEESVLAVCMRI